MAEEEALPLIERLDGFHLLISKPEIEDIEILRDTVRIHRLRYCHDTPLREPTKNSLSH